MWQPICFYLEKRLVDLGTFLLVQNTPVFSFLFFFISSLSKIAPASVFLPPPPCFSD